MPPVDGLVSSSFDESGLGAGTEMGEILGAFLEKNQRLYPAGISGGVQPSSNLYSV